MSKKKITTFEELRASDRENASEEFKQRRVKARITSADIDKVQEIIKTLGIKVPEASSDDVIYDELFNECCKNKKIYNYVMKPVSIRCKYDFICSITLKATSRGRRQSGKFFPHEIVDFPAYLLDVKNLTLESVFHSYVKPIVHPVTEGSTSLTGISYSFTDEAPEFERVHYLFDDWISSYIESGKSILIATDGPRDFGEYLALACLMHNKIVPQFAKSWVDMRNVYKKTYKHLNSTGSLTELMNNVGIPYDGQTNDGADDSHNLTKLVCLMLEDGVELEVTNHLSPEKFRFLRKKLLSHLEQDVPVSNPALPVLIRKVKNRKDL